MIFKGKYHKMMEKVEFPTWIDVETKFDGQLVIITTDGQQMKVIDGIQWIKTTIFVFDKFLACYRARHDQEWSGWAQGLVWTGEKTLTAIVEPKWF